MLCYVYVYVMLCYVMLCYVMLCYVMLCYVRHVSNALETMSSTLVCIGNHTGRSGIND